MKEVNLLVLEKNKFEGRIPNYLGDLKKIVFLDLSDNNFSGSFPVGLGLIDSLVKLDLKNNDLSGTMATQIWRLKKLKEIDVSNNNFEENVGFVFQALGRNIKKINLSGNNFKGKLDSMIKFNYLEVMDISLNKIGGQIPKKLYNLRHLQTLNLSGNFLKGRIPNEMGYLSKLVNLFLDNNESLTGEIPLQFSNLKNVKILTFNNTNVCLPNDLNLTNWMVKIDNLRQSKINCPLNPLNPRNQISKTKNITNGN